jgi:hypothetical protein
VSHQHNIPESTFILSKYSIDDCIDELQSQGKFSLTVPIHDLSRNASRLYSAFPEYHGNDAGQSTRR